MLVGTSKERVSITMKWDIIPKIVPNPNWAMGVLRQFAHIANLV